MKKLIREIKKAVFLLLLLVGQAWADTVYLASLSWPPYSGEELKQQGSSVAVARAAFEAMGHELVVDFYPWSRSVKLAADANSKYAGYFPEYHYSTSQFAFSDAMGQGPLGLLEKSRSPLAWSKISDLQRYQLGVVRDYVNTAEIDLLIAKGVLQVQAAISDELNIKKVNAGRIDGAIIDVNVFHYLLRQEEQHKVLKEQLQINNRLLANKKLYVAFKKNHQSARWLAIYNQGLARINVQEIMEGYLLSMAGDEP
ncbi:transporter substrate-binding domain-containing protein [Thalassomonas viridans]|uniref:Transporter substrate-binding domain-containing protein n=1 Tax=Thalassomonas viridans TaxID=137584 RepID=A0AAE9Z4J2_9GAMM|nr:transporter substrate-binding domain-containing protein [Thalassomonas viridans]WDE06520.1 transporter substrate-binding domain-containing protein [Thalassomonas viridans]